MRKSIPIIAAAIVAVVATGPVMANENKPAKKDAAEAPSAQPVDDTWITTKVKSTLLADTAVAGTKIDVDTVNGVVYLTGTAGSQFLSRIERIFTGQPPRGSNVVLSLDADVQRAAYEALGDLQGAVLAIEPSTGRVLAMVTSPSYDTNLLASHNTTEVNATLVRTGPPEAWEIATSLMSPLPISRPTVVALRPKNPM